MKRAILHINLIPSHDYDFERIYESPGEFYKKK